MATPYMYPSYQPFPTYPGTGFSAGPVGFPGFPTAGFPSFPPTAAPKTGTAPPQTVSFPGQNPNYAGSYTMPSHIPGYPIIVGPVINPVQPPAPAPAAPAPSPMDITDPEQWAHKLTLYPDKVTIEDEILLQKLAQFGPDAAGKDGLPGFPYIGAPYIGVYNDDLGQERAAPQEEEAYDEEDIRGTQV